MTAPRDPSEVEPRDAGRAAAWNGRAIWSNPYVGVEADDWRRGWRDASADIAAGRPRPTDLPVTAHGRIRYSRAEAARKGGTALWRALPSVDRQRRRPTDLARKSTP